MRLLLDTQVALWWLVASPRLNRASRDLIAATPCVVSVASIWEVAIKYRLGKLPVSPLSFRDEMQAAGATILPISDSHVIATVELALRHRDPFDHLLLATAMLQSLVLLTADQALLALLAKEPGLPVKSV